MSVAGALTIRERFRLLLEVAHAGLGLLARGDAEIFHVLQELFKPVELVQDGVEPATGADRWLGWLRLLALSSCHRTTP